jgi:hypothetical protein
MAGRPRRDAVSSAATRDNYGALVDTIGCDDNIKECVRRFENAKKGWIEGGVSRLKSELKPSQIILKNNALIELITTQ